MKLNTPPRSKRKTATIVALMIATGLTGLAILEVTHITNFVHIFPSPSTGMGATQKELDTQKKIEQDQKQEFIESPSPSANQAPMDAKLELSARQESNGSVTILTKLTDISEGTCKLVVQANSLTYEQTADVIYQPEFSSCAGFTVPKEKLGPGNWTIQLTLPSQNALEKTITFKVT